LTIIPKHPLSSIVNNHNRNKNAVSRGASSTVEDPVHIDKSKNRNGKMGERHQLKKGLGATRSRKIVPLS